MRRRWAAAGHRLAHAVTAGSLAAATVNGQVVRGTVTDSVSRQPVPGAVVTVLGAADAAIARAITSERGAFTVLVPDSAVRLRIVRIGFRPRIVVAPSRGAAVTLDVRMERIPTLIEPVRVDAVQCPHRPDSDRALGLWEQGRAALLTSVVAREQVRGMLVRVGVERHFRGTSPVIERQSVQVDTVERAVGSYVAAFDPESFVQRGFSTNVGDEWMFYAPDADVLLDPVFSNGYCFQLAPRDRARPGQVGLAFAPADRKAGRVDVLGTLWVDTVARALRDITFTFRNIGRGVDELQPGGVVGLREMPNGVVFIDHWRLRLVGTVVDSTCPRPGSCPNSLRHAYVEHLGEVAHARWPDNSTYDASLGRLELRVTRADGTPALGATVALEHTPYAATLDSTGWFIVDDLVPGPYRLAVRDPRLGALNLREAPVEFGFNAVRDSVHRSVVVLPTIEDWVASRCAGQDRAGAAAAPGAQAPVVGPLRRSLLVGRVVDEQGTPQSGLAFSVARADPFARERWTTVMSNGRIGSDGVFQACLTGLEPGAHVAFTVYRGRGEVVARIEHAVGAERLSIVPKLVVP